MVPARLVQIGTQGRVVELTGDTVLGRSSDATIPLKDSRVSKQHAVLTPEGDGWTIRDVGSRNGVVVNGITVHERALRDGDELAIGAFLLRFRLGPDRFGPEPSAGQSWRGWILEARIGQGGSGAVFRARRSDTDEVAALKVMSGLPKTVRERLRSQRVPPRAVGHPNVIDTTAILDRDGIPVLVQGLVAGMSLAEVIRRGRLTPDQLDELGFGLLAGLAETHRVGIVHGDFKPTNAIVEVGEGGSMIGHVGDHGLWRFRESRSPEGAQRSGAPISDPSRGPPAYTAPEVIAGEAPSERSDVYSAGAVLYEMATGRRAFPGDADEVVDAIERRARPTATSVEPRLSTRFADAIEAALAQDPAMRPANAGALLDAWVGSPFG